jgi:glycosyltransferase involved in cell wall biosynthesis
MKICIFTSAHLVNDIRVFKKELISLLKNGYEVIYYTNSIDKNMDKSYVQNSNHAEFEHQNLKIIYNNDYNEKNRIKRFLRSFLIYFNLDKNCDIYHFHDPDLIISGLLLKLIGKKVIYDVHENYVNTIEEKEYIPKKLQKSISFLFEKLETFASKRFDSVICATSKISERFKLVGVKNVVTINNFPFKDELLIESNNNVKNNTIIYTGGITKKRGITQLINAIEIVNKKINCRLIMAGEIPKDYHEELKKLKGWGFVEYKGLLSRKNMSIELSKAKIGVVLFLPEKNHIDAQPNKLFEYMSAKLPIVCSSFPLWESIVTKNKIGLSANPLNPQEIASAITTLLKKENELKEMGNIAKNLVDTKYNWDKEEQKLIELYKKLEGRSYE